MGASTPHFQRGCSSSNSAWGPVSSIAVNDTMPPGGLPQVSEARLQEDCVMASDMEPLGLAFQPSWRFCELLDKSLVSLYYLKQPFSFLGLKLGICFSFLLLLY